MFALVMVKSEVWFFLFGVFFFFFKQKTAYEMRISDWSSDVCSSDLFANFPEHPFALLAYCFQHDPLDYPRPVDHTPQPSGADVQECADPGQQENGSDRELDRLSDDGDGFHDGTAISVNA